MNMIDYLKPWVPDSDCDMQCITYEDLIDSDDAFLCIESLDA